jgi:hypothetical protein
MESNGVYSAAPGDRETGGKSPFSSKSGIHIAFKKKKINKVVRERERVDYYSHYDCVSNGNWVELCSTHLSCV